MVLVLALWAFPAAAGHRHGDDNGSRDGHGHRYARQVEIAELAQQLVRATRRVHRQAEKGAHHHSRREARALRSLHRLDHAARDFYSRTRHDEAPSPRELRRLVRAYQRAQARFDSLHLRRPVEREFERAGRLVQRVERVYARRSRAGTGRHAHHATRRRPLFRVDLAWRY
jgi:hypothetical protein